MKFLLFLYFFFSITISIYAQSQAEISIRQIMAAQEQAWNSGDLKGFMQGYWQTDSLSFIGKRGITYGWQATLENYQKSYPDKSAMGILTFDILKIDLLSKKTAYVVGKWRLQRSNDMPNGYFTLLWKKIKGKWVIVSDHSS